MDGWLLLSQILTLFTTPVVYLYLDLAKHGWDETKRRVASGHSATRSAYIEFRLFGVIDC
jgi:hypothetical protein